MSITETGLSLYFASDRPGGSGNLEIYVSRRSSLNDPWGAPTNLGTTINSNASDHCPFVTPDGHRLMFISTRPGGQGIGDVWMSFRRNELDDLAWETPEVVTEVNSTADECCPTGFIHPQTGAFVFFFSSTRPGGPGGNDFYTSTLQPSGKFSTPVLVPELSSSATDTFLMVRPNGLEATLSSNRTGTLGNQDLWSTTRATINEPWSTPVNLGAPVNTSANEQRGGIYAGGTRMAFFSNRTGASGANDLYEVTRTRTTSIPVVGSVTGVAGTVFRTAGSISNATATTAAGNLVFHPAGQVSGSDPVLAYTLNPFETRTFADLLAAFGAAGLGWLEIVPATGPAPAALLRIEDGGVVGVPPITDSHILVAGTRGVLLTPDLTRFRLNIGVRTFGSGATMTVSLVDAAGAPVRTTSRSLPPNFFAQFSAADLAGGPIASNQAIIFSIDAGSAAIYGSVVANTGGGSMLQFAQRIEP